MPCLAHHHHHPRLPAANHCKSLSCLIRETYAHCHVPCIRIPGAGWSSDDDDDDDALDTKQVILNEIRNRQLRKESRCSVDSPALSSAFIWFFTPLDPRSVLEKVSSPEKHVLVGEEKEGAEAEAGSDAGDVESEAFFSVKSFFTRSTSRAATVASLTDMDPPATWDGFRNCEGWPFGLCRRPAVPPLPSTPADSWKWRKQSSGRNLAASPRPAYSHNKITTS
ncbi:hypothetical protein D1007_00392 [Hordeum vulgare]|uniref:Uncharacterized protein n=1 Tax=Hordeum vulgare subsp. vulgare TaxID=112509 RepID=A0A8I6XGB4_HORVV|nr:uncharacterized protein LOC123395815 [Hordeum vulgare subsp. vulgare]KAE8821610.1 hypothetical protein D1007_00392 [Hordeum vulgare]KAI4990116.1 hypothetical protein ZWY2020_038479 [Hordeum vulgare]